MKVLTIGDVVGKPGRQAVTHFVPALRKEHGIDLVIANSENTAAGHGLTLDTARDLFDAQVDVLTSGNHAWDQKDIIPHMDGELLILRPLNYPEGTPGRGYLITRGAMIVNLMGRTFMQSIDDPFRAMDRLLARVTDKPNVIIVDMHCEATSEKGAMGWYLDGRVSAVVGTHTHVGTIDAQVLPKGTAFVTDIGMSGPKLSVIGDEPSDVLARFLTAMPTRLNVAKGPVRFSAILLDIDESNGKARSIQRIDRELE